MKAKVAAYITLYKDKEAAWRCIQAIKAQSTQVDAIFIIDNSDEELLVLDNDELILIHHYPSNIGIGQGLVLAFEWATKQGYDFLWTFDQDSVPSTYCLEILLTTYNKLSSEDGYKIGIIAPTPIDPRTGEVIEGAVFSCDRFVGRKHNKNIDFYECDAPITSGSLIYIPAAKIVSPPRADLFIDGIDLDYGLRLRREGFHNLIIPTAIMYHDFGNPVQVKFYNKKFTIQKYSELRNYYISRNHTYLETRYSQGRYLLTSCLRRIRYLLRTVVLILLYDSENKALKVWACVLGTFHGFKGKLGKTW